MSKLFTRRPIVDPAANERAMRKAIDAVTGALLMEDTINKSSAATMARMSSPRVPGSWSNTGGPSVNLLNRVAGNLASAFGRPSAEVEQAMTQQGLTWGPPFPPGRPLDPFFGIGRPARLWDYAVGENVQIVPRWGRISYKTIRSLWESYDVAQICTTHLINDVISLDYHFEAGIGIREDVSEDVTKARQFLDAPDKEAPFREWLFKLLMGVVVFDAGCLYIRRNEAGDPIALEVVDGATILKLIDYYGRTPSDPDNKLIPEGMWEGSEVPAYVQIIEGMSWDWLFKDDLIYQPWHPQPNSQYGRCALEAVLLTANTDIRFQWHFLNYFTRGSIPQGFMEAPPDLSDPAAIAKWNADWDALMLGDQARLRQITWVPAGSKYTPVGPGSEKFDPEFPLYLMRRVCAAFGVTPADLGFTECYSADTEVLTDEGWRTYDQLEVGVTRVADYNPETGGIEYHPITHKYAENYEGDMVHFKTRSVDTLVTPGHRMWASSAGSGWREWRADQLETSGEFWFLQPDVLDVSVPEPRVAVDCPTSRLGKEHVSRVPYNGTVWCVEVPHHLFVTRRNGAVAIQGNTVNKATSETQVDVQFRVGTLPLVRYVEDVINMFLTQHLKLKVRIRFDTGREIEDRLATAQAETLYIDHGVLSPDEPRARMGYPVSLMRPTPRYVNNTRQGPIPLLAVESMSGDTDVETFAPTKDAKLIDHPFVPLPGVLPTPGSQDAKDADNSTAAMGANMVAAAGGKKLPYPDKTLVPATSTHPPQRPMSKPPVKPTPVKKAQLDAAGIAVVARESGRVLLIQRDNDDPDKSASSRWELPGGRIEPGEDAWEAAQREWQEETANKLPPGHVVSTWSKKNYRAFVYLTNSEASVNLNPHRSEMEVLDPDHPSAKKTEVMAWWNPDDARDGGKALRRELRKFDWSLIDDCVKEMTGGITAASGMTGVDLRGRDDDDEDDEDEDAKKELLDITLRRWKENARNRLRKGLPPRRFYDPEIPPELNAAIWQGLEGATTREAIDRAFSGGS